LPEEKAGVYSSYDWTIKADADAVFFVDKLIPRIKLMPVPPLGAFLRNCLSGFETKKLVDTCGGWKFAKRKLTGQCVNTGIIYKAWPAIREAGVYSSFDWTIMADAGAVFFVDQLIPSIQLMPVPPSGAFLWNCPKMDFGFCCSLGARNLDVCQVLGDSCTFDVGGLILLKCSA